MSIIKVISGGPPVATGAGMNFDDLMGKRCDFYGVDNNRFRLGFEGTRYTFEAVEDEDDGYRSSLDTVRTVPDMEASGIFFDTPVAMVIPIDVDDPTSERFSDGFFGSELVDATTGHVWLRLGTGHVTDYYPCFVCSYEPSGEQHPVTDETGG